MQSCFIFLLLSIGLSLSVSHSLILVFLLPLLQHKNSLLTLVPQGNCHSQVCLFALSAISTSASTIRTLFLTSHSDLCCCDLSSALAEVIILSLLTLWTYYLIIINRITDLLSVWCVLCSKLQLKLFRCGQWFTCLKSPQFDLALKI